MAQVEAFMRFLKARRTGLKQKSTDWVEARKNTIGASEFAALTGHSPFETLKSLQGTCGCGCACFGRPGCLGENIMSLFPPLLGESFNQEGHHSKY